ncbi:hypothetical protein SteCoe_27852 [Stentor coeruleus]|uniref:Arb2 domain-containing protein n=1 Tax=Stentor coeruleus TaxID=5963 RepID=A0A1R2B9J7_9CILI|nr:hypothetical protein SteCoe_27852 [Stentor coeruleus]
MMSSEVSKDPPTDEAKINEGNSIEQKSGSVVQSSENLITQEKKDFPDSDNLEKLEAINPENPNESEVKFLQNSVEPEAKPENLEDHNSVEPEAKPENLEDHNSVEPEAKPENLEDYNSIIPETEPENLEDHKKHESILLITEPKIIDENKPCEKENLPTMHEEAKEMAKEENAIENTPTMHKEAKEIIKEENTIENPPTMHEEAKEIKKEENTIENPPAMHEEAKELKKEENPIENIPHVLEPKKLSSLEKLREEFGYEFDKDQVLRDIKTNEKFKFKGQSHYEMLGDVIQKYVQEQMIEKYGLEEVWIPLDEHDDSGIKCNVFMTKTLRNTDGNHREKLMLLIQGAGAVRAGLWARSVCINDSLITGSVFPFLDYANKNNFEVLVFNPNYNYDKASHKSIPFNSSLEKHGNYLWKNFIRSCQAHDIYIVGHSCGGISTVSLMNSFWEEFKSRVKGIAFTDAVHGYHGMTNEKLKFMRRYAVDWVASSAPLDTIQTRYSSDIIYVSSGHSKHEYTTGSAYPKIFEFFNVVKDANPYEVKITENLKSGKKEENKKSYKEKVVENPCVEKEEKGVLENPCVEKEEKGVVENPCGQKEEKVVENPCEKKEEKKVVENPCEKKEEEKVVENPCEKKEEEKVVENPCEKKEEEKVVENPCEKKEEEGVVENLCEKKEEESVVENLFEKKEEEKVVENLCEKKEEEGVAENPCEKKEEKVIENPCEKKEVEDKILESEALVKDDTKVQLSENLGDDKIIVKAELELVKTEEPSESEIPNKSIIEEQKIPSQSTHEDLLKPEQDKKDPTIPTEDTEKPSTPELKTSEPKDQLNEILQDQPKPQTSPEEAKNELPPS